MLSVLQRPMLCSVRIGKSVRQPQNIRWLGRGSGGRRVEPPGMSAPPSGRLPLAKPIIFTGAVGATCFVGASIWQYEEMRAKMLARTNQMMPHFMQPRHQKSGSLRQHVNVWWNSLSEGQRIFMPILACNVAVFAAWRVPRLRNVMLKYFSADPSQSAVCWPMLLSTFSHHSFLHLAANMYVLHSFSTGAVATLGKEQFLALYLGAGVASSLASHVYKLAIKMPGRSLGASGAIMAILGYVCTMHPDTRLSIIFLPQFHFTADAAIKCLVAFDAAGALLRWRFFDHAAHLGGALAGIIYGLWGHHLWLKREPFITWWHNMRGSVTK